MRGAHGGDQWSGARRPRAGAFRSHFEASEADLRAEGSERGTGLVLNLVRRSYVPSIVRL